MLSAFDTAAFVPGRGLYVFAGDAVWRYGVGAMAPDVGFPRRITAEFPGIFARDLDAALMHPDGSFHLFRGDQHIRYDIGRRRPEVGFPRPYLRDWPGLFPGRIDAALTWDPDIIYVFSGDHYTSFSPRRGEVRRGFPKVIYGNWPELDGGPVRVALSLPGDRRVLISGGGARWYDRHGNPREAELELPMLADRGVSHEGGDPGTSPFLSPRFRDSPPRGAAVWQLEGHGEAQVYDEPMPPPMDGPRVPFDLAALPATVQQAFTKGGAGWLQAVPAAIAARIVDPRRLADLMFFMQHPERMTAGVGKLIEEKETDFVKLRAEWILYFTIVTRILKPSTKPTVCVPARSSTNYEDFVAAPTTGRITLMVHGRNSDGSGGFRDELEALDRMERTVESLGPGDSVYIANWQFIPTALLLTADPSGSKARSWAHLLKDKACQGVKIRVIIAKHPVKTEFETDPAPLDKVIGSIDEDRRDNFKYLMTRHPDIRGVHHEKFMVAKKGNTAVAFCGGLDLSIRRAPPGWHLGFVWHDVVAMLEGRIVRDLEREFVERWNRERSKSTVKPLAGWKPFEELKPTEPSAADKSGPLNQHALQMLRTVCATGPLLPGPTPPNIRRDDIWRGYFRLIGRATRFIYLEDQYFHEPKLAEAIVRQAESQPGLIVIVMVGTGTDDREALDPKAIGDERDNQQAAVDLTQNGFALRLEFFKRLSVPPLTPDRLRVYTLNYSSGILHTKLIMVDDEALSVGSANANGRGFFLDTELNVMLDNAEATRSFRHRLWGHNLGVAPDKVATWSVPQFFDHWDSVAKSNEALQATPAKMVGEGVIPFKPLFKPPHPKDNPRFREGKRGPIHWKGFTIELPDAAF